MTAGSVYDQAVEVMARAAYAKSWEYNTDQSLPPVIDGWYEGCEGRETWVDEARAALDALLAARRDIPCPTCGEMRAHGFEPHEACSDCSNGVVPGAEPLILLGPVQVGVIGAEPSMAGERKTFTGHVRAPQKDSEYRVFRDGSTDQ